MKVTEALEYCYKYRDEFIRDFDSIDEGIEQFDGLIVLLDSGTIKPDEIADYGMEF